jgi:glycosyltransferase involved in cell wall biosynthesis
MIIEKENDCKPKISVCLATFNGERYLREQLLSILNQISMNDEVIIVDDASSDKTVAIINSLKDNRILLYESEKNYGHVKSFSKAIKLSKGDIIFLSDQDDIWTENKYNDVIKTFQNYPKVSMIVHGLSIINSDGILVSKNWLNFEDTIPNRSIYLIKQIYKTRVFGSAVAFRSNILSLLLPFPKFVYAHDHWITIIATLRGSIKLHSSQLVLRRIHTNNLTPINGSNIFRKIYCRIIYIILIVVGLYRMQTTLKYKKG